MNVDDLKLIFYNEMEKRGRIKENFSSNDLFKFLEEKKFSFSINDEEQKEGYNLKPIHNILE